MSVLCSNDKGWVISHYDYSKNLYKNVLSQSGRVDLAYSENLFNIITPLMKDQEAQKMLEILYVESSCSQTVSKLIKRPFIPTDVDSEVQLMQDVFSDIIQMAKGLGYFNREPSKGDILDNNSVSRNFVDKFYTEENENLMCEEIFEGGNNSCSSQIVDINNKKYVLPPSCKFILSDVGNIQEKLINLTFDFVLLDPPWKNKFVKRKRRKCEGKGYQMMNNSSIAEIPIDIFLSWSGLVGVWCTNASSHVRDIKELFFPKWGLEYVATWFWLKVTVCGEPICPFLSRNGKKPYERIVFGARKNRTLKIPEENKCFMSVPSALHSHKPPLTDLLQGYLPKNAKCLELFARYLLPNWTSVGNQVLMLQSLALYDEISTN